MSAIRLLSSLTFGLVGIPACATGAQSFDRETGSRARVQLDFATVSTDAADPMFPAVVDPRLPSADRIAPRIRTLLGDSASADITLCVAPTGRVASVALVRSSQMPSFDVAMMKDVSAWQFTSSPGPATVKTCEQFTISYRPHG